MKDLTKLAIVSLISGSIVATVGFDKWYYNHIESKLEPYAINCGNRSNLAGGTTWKMNLPWLKNVDLDGNGKLESIILYVNNGKKIYQEIRKTENGGLVLNEPKQWK